MEYIQCTSCNKKYGVNDKIRAAAGRIIKCKSCQDTFTIVVHDTEAKEVTPEPAVASQTAAGWDPAKTMPPSEDAQAEKKSSSSPEDDEDVEHDEELAALKQAQAKKKKQQMYIAAGLGACLLVGVAFLFMMGDDEATVSPSTLQPKTMQQQSANRVDPALSDHDNLACREAAATQWTIDSTIMHADYTAEAYVQLLKDSQLQSAAVRDTCSDPAIIQEILQAATQGVMPSWFEAEIHALLGDAPVAEPSTDSPAPTDPTLDTQP